MSLPIMTSGGPSIGCEASQPLFFFQKPILGTPLSSHMYVYMEVDSQPGPDRVGIAYPVENEKT